MKKIIPVLMLVLTIALSIVLLKPVEAEAATNYDFLFPVNNGGVNIAFLYGYTSQYDGGKTFHRGIDIYSTGDQVIYASFSGTVTSISNSCPCVDYPSSCSHYNSWGNCIQIKSTDGSYYGIYGHLKQNSMLVKVGDKVERGQALASMGSSGGSYNKHLHFELRTNPGDRETSINVNPTNASQNKGVVTYSTTGYKPVQSDTITEGTYRLSNDGYRMYMIKDSAAKSTIGASNATADAKFDFKIVKDGNNYRIFPQNSEKSFNVYWTAHEHSNRGWNASDPNYNFAIDGDEITLWTSSSSDYSQKWIFEEYNGGYLIHPACTPGFAITREGSKLVVRKTSYSSAQIWKIEGDCDHEYKYTYKTNKYHTVTCTKCGETTEKVHQVGDKIHYNNTHCYTYCSLCETELDKTLHKFTNDCDTSCNFCPYTRTITHTYDNACDKDCNVCGNTRTTSHTYSNNCDTSCNVCGNTRTTSHTYSNSCDTSCNVCGATRATSHTYTNNCDTNCNVCGAIRTIAHAYDNDCDTSCNVCGNTRTVSHSYANDCDTSCDLCGATRTTSHSYTNSCDKTCNKCNEERAVVHTYTDICDEECNVCGEKRTDCHAYGEWNVVTAATCTTEGTKAKTCSVCGDTKEETIAKIDHKLSASQDGSNIKHECLACDYSYTTPLENVNNGSDNYDASSDSAKVQQFRETTLILGGSMIIGLTMMGLVSGLARRGKGKSKKDD